jgi:hypothetical protein
VNCPVRLTYTTQPDGVGAALAVGDGEVSRTLAAGLADSCADGVPSVVEGLEPHPASTVADATARNDLRIMDDNSNGSGG